MTDKKIGTYTVPFISKPENGEWCVFFRFYHPGRKKMVPVKRSEQINRIKNLTEKEKEFKALLEARKLWLEMGWNPHEDPDFLNRPGEAEEQEEKQPSEIDLLKKKTFPEALDFAYEKKLPDWKKKTRQCFHSSITYLKLAAERLKLANKPITELKRPNYIDILENIRQVQKLMPQGFNKYRGYLSNLLDKMVEYEMLEYNPIDAIKKKKIIKIKANRPPTKDEQLLIMNRVREVSRNYYRYLAVLYGCCIRPQEACYLKIKDLHRIEQIFRLVPDQNAGSENTKTSTERDAVIPDWVLDLLAEMNLHKYDAEWYIFSHYNMYESSTKSKYDSFVPGPHLMHRKHNQQMVVPDR